MRFSFHHAPEPPRNRFWWLVGLVVLLFAIPIAAFNLAVDPFDFRFTPHLALIRESISRKNDTVLWTVGELRRLPEAALQRVTIAVVGDSRTDTLCRWPGSPRIFQLGGDLLINLSVGGASLGENMKMLEAELPRLPHLRAVLFSVPVERAGVPDSDRTDSAFRFANHPALYAVGLGTLGASLDLLAQQSAARRGGELPVDKPDIDPGKIPGPARAGLDIPGEVARAGKTIPLSKVEQGIASGWRLTLSNIDPARLRKRVLNEIKPLVDRLGRRGIRVVFFFPPLHPAVSGGLETTIAQLQAPYVADLGKLGVVENYSMGTRDGIVPVFADSMHLQQDVAHAVLADIYLRDFTTPPNHP